MRLSRLCWPVFLLCLCPAGQAQVADDKWDRADRETVRLQPTHFAEAPKTVKATLRELGCRIPQPWAADTKKPHNLIRGEFMEAGRTQWAALCSRKRPGWTSAIIVIDENGGVQAELASKQERFHIQGVGGGKIGYSRALYPASADHILSMYQAYGGPEPPPMDHKGIQRALFPRRQMAEVDWCGLSR